jgi:AAA domain
MNAPTAPDPLAEHMASVARMLCGAPNPMHSKPGKPRWGNKGSLAIDEERGIWFDHESGQGGGVLALIEREKGMTGREAFEWMNSIGCHVEQAKPRGKVAKANGSRRPIPSQARQELLETYDYTNESGEMLFQVVRLGYRKPDDSLVLSTNGKPEKTFRQRRPDSDEPKVWVWALSAGDVMRKGPGQDWYRFDEQRWSTLPAAKERKTIEAAARTVPYRLPEIIEAISLEHTIFIVEGEQKADALYKYKIPATCNAGGAGKWTPECSGYLRGADVVILPDNDAAGRAHGDAIAQSLQGIANRVRMLELPDLPDKGDIVDWQNAGHTREELDALLDQAVEWQPAKQPAPAATPAAAPAATTRSNLSAKELNTMTFAPIKYVVPGIIVEGLTLFAGKPKIGKSWLLLHAAAAVASSGFTLGDIHCIEGDVLYCALEDNLRRLQSRMTKLYGTQEWPERLFFRCEMPRLAEGGLQVIKDWIKTAKLPRLVIIDTLAMVRAPKKRDESSYESDYNAVKELRALANEYGIAIVLVHHLRKQEADDAFDTVSGTLGLTGAPDTILVLKRESATSIVLHGRGRDLIEIEKAMTFNPDSCTWTIAGELSEVRATDQRKAILAAMREIELPASPQAIAITANLKRPNVSKTLQRMADDGVVQKAAYGKYDLTAAQKHA